MSPSNSGEAKRLTPDQKAAAEQLCHALEEYMEHPDQRSEEESFGTFGLFGPRGSGKSTVVDSIRNKMEKERPKLFVCKALDLSSISTEIPLGITVVEYIRRQIHEVIHPGEQRAASDEPGHFWSDRPSPEEDQETKSWKRLLEQYVRTDKRHRNLELQLAVSPMEYQEMAQRELETRGGLRRAIEPWLDEALRSLTETRERSPAGRLDRSPKEWVLVPLEDCDLVENSFQTWWITTFLDELRDHRLLFLMVADDANIEGIALKSAGRPSSQATTIGKIQLDLLAKLMPMTHRAYLDPWDLQEITSFRLEPASGKTLSTRLEEQLARGGPEMPRITDLIRLLPRYPRGLVDLYRGFERLPKDDSGLLGKLPGKLLALVARCRGDRRPARQLPLRPPDWWGSRLQWNQEQLDRIRWSQIAAEARDEMAPIWALQPEEIPLQGLGDEDQALWAELLLNISLHGQPGALGGILRRFSPIRKKVAECHFGFQPNPVELVRQARSDVELLASPWLRFRGQTADQAKIEVGWSPLIDHALKRDHSTLNQVLTDLAVRPPRSPVKPIADSLLPREIRSLIILSDEMARLPWSDLGDWAHVRNIEDWQLMLSLLCGEIYLRVREEYAFQRASGEGAQQFEEIQDEPTEGLRKRLQQLIRKSQRKLQPANEELSNHPMVAATREFFATARPLSRKPKNSR